MLGLGSRNFVFDVVKMLFKCFRHVLDGLCLEKIECGENGALVEMHHEFVGNDFVLLMLYD